MSYPVKNGQTSVVLRFKLLDSSSTVGGGLTGLTSASSGLRISTIADNESAATAYTVAGSTVEAVTTLGTYAAPTATKCRFKEVDATNHPGLYEFQFADARFAVASAKSLIVSVSGATNLVQADFVVPLVVDDPYTAKLTDKTGYSLSQTFPANFASLSIDGSGRVDLAKIAGTAQTARDIGASVLVAGDFSATMKTSLNAATPAVTVSDKTGFKLSSDGLAAVTAWTIAITGNITGNLSGSVGSVTTVSDKTGYSLTQAFPSNFAALGIGAGGHILNVDTLTTYTGNTPQTGDAFALIGAAGAGLTALGDTRLAHLDADVSSRSTYAGADTSGTTTLLGRLTSTRAGLLDNLDAAVSTRSTFAGGAVASVTGNVGGNVAGSVGSVTGLTASDVGAIKAKTDNLPASPAAVGSAMTLTVAYDAAKTAAQAGDAMTLTGAYDAAKTAATQTSVDNLPTNAELATALAGADDATLAAIAALPTATTVNAIKAKTDGLPSDPADQSLVIAATDAIMSRLGAPANASVSADLAAVKADTASTKAKTDQMVFTNANELNVNVHSMNDVRLTGTGIANTDEWRPA